ncbi:MAG: hypothetical protein A3I32_02735 [Candidatus Yanofskybacteria bacterium RIFCSPLOWO2_02_FULL_45_10]|uniref:HTH merR-type domain-containing protein n=2 Tax=Candidatus Yanofskyibacteriota TaxID=1752733 RepID=A0A1F8G1S5_9BACT|nr:MAG: hypothetical protein A3F25_00595 [Candidatus Yanofskybacteria bacterium RIFCSPHIGHO2_12_FULL_45_19b]OGN31571.1 MAG: hypothetical protein A3I32_02735 [Candidatus Yanofskybacteria bacterium RIFCSPLOWO2_02_FULL_45_10]
MPKKFLTVNEVAKIVGVSPLTVRNWDQRGLLIAHRNPLNNYRLYRVEDVEALVNKIETSQGSGSNKIIKPPTPKTRKLEIETE